MKKVAFNGKRPTATTPANPDDWVADRDKPPTEPAKRLTINVPLGLHRRIKIQCAQQELVIADVVRELLERRFPELQNQEPGAGQGAQQHDGS
ncbi:MAG: hypothetical protein AAF628_27730 [Planctomycetota bacterium]